MGIFGGRRQRGMTPTEEAARRRGTHIPAGVAHPGDTAEAHRPKPNVAGDVFEVKTLSFSQVGFVRARTDVDAKLAPRLAAGWEVVTEDRKRYGVGGKHVVTIRRPRSS